MRGIYNLLQNLIEGDYVSLAWMCGGGLVLVFIIFLVKGKTTGSGETIGGVSTRIGYDVRDLLVAGYSWEEIGGIERGEYTLEELLKRGPAR